jgi:hypothetical protein
LHGEAGEERDEWMDWSWLMGKKGEEEDGHMGTLVCYANMEPDSGPQAAADVE